jgi:ABC-type glycerol-3-phosphate transport system permease component
LWAGKRLIVVRTVYKCRFSPCASCGGKIGNKEISMKSTTAGVASGCVVWVVVFFALSICLCPVAVAISSVTSGTDFVARTLGPTICPANTTPHINSYDTTTTDENGNTSPATGYELQCLNSDGKVVMTDPVGYAFAWMGLFVAGALILAIVLAFVVAGPAGVLIARLMNRNQTPTTP